MIAALLAFLAWSIMTWLKENGPIRKNKKNFKPFFYLTRIVFLTISLIGFFYAWTYDFQAFGLGDNISSGFYGNHPLQSLTRILLEDGSLLLAKFLKVLSIGTTLFMICISALELLLFSMRNINQIRNKKKV